MDWIALDLRLLRNQHCCAPFIARNPQRVEARKRLMCCSSPKIIKTKLNGYIRSLFFFSRFKGNEVKATIFDEGSSDDTRKIIERLSHSHLLELRYQTDYDAVDHYLRQHDNEPVTVVHLSSREDLVKIPLVEGNGFKYLVYKESKVRNEGSTLRSLFGKRVGMAFNDSLTDGHPILVRALRSRRRPRTVRTFCFVRAGCADA